MKKTSRNTLIISALLGVTLLLGLLLLRPPSAQLDTFWDQSNTNSTATISHQLWQQTLDDYLITEHSSGINRVDYEGLQEEGLEMLQEYLQKSSAIDPRNYNRAEQFAFWVNLYNALTVKLVSDNYPVNSIKELGNSSLGLGPWDDDIINIASRTLTLNDIEHRILRPIWQDYRIHFAVNCASVGCPNLLAETFSAKNQQRLLEQGSHDYLSHPRGLRLDDEKLRLSSIFDWYKEDFGSTQHERLDTLSQHLPEALRAQLADYNGAVEFHYDWQLNAE